MARKRKRSTGERQMYVKLPGYSQAITGEGHRVTKVASSDYGKVQRAVYKGYGQIAKSMGLPKSYRPSEPSKNKSAQRKRRRK